MNLEAPDKQPKPEGDQHAENNGPELSSGYSDARKTPADRQREPGIIGRTVIELDRTETEAFEAARKRISIAQILALVSLVFGGVLLSGVAIALSIIGYRMLADIAEHKADRPDAQRALKRSGILAIVTSSLALAVNVISIVMIYPIIMQILQDGDVAGALGMAGQAPVTPSEIPGAELFG